MPPAPPAHLTNGLRENLIGLLEGRAASRQVQAVVNLAVALAVEYLTRKRGAWRVQERLGLPAVDLATDCIADLFERDATGRYRQLEAYFSSIETGVLDEAELLVLLRRLVYSRVSHALFRLYQDIDPAFSKILRNVKLAQSALKQFDERDRFGETCFIPVLCDAQDHLPAIEQPDLEAALLAECNGTESVPVMMGKMALLLRRQEDCARTISIMTVASTIKAVYEIKNRPQLQPFTQDDPLGDGDAAALVSMTCAAVKASMRESYTSKKKVTQGEYESYFSVIEDNLLEKMSGKDGDALSYFDLLRSRLPDLTVDEYRRRHRSRLEYLGSLVQKRLVTAIKRG